MATPSTASSCGAKMRCDLALEAFGGVSSSHGFCITVSWRELSPPRTLPCPLLISNLSPGPRVLEIPTPSRFHSTAEL